MTLHNNTIFSKFYKLLAELNEVLNFKKFIIHVLSKFNLNLICAGCYLYFLIGNLTQNV